MSQLGYRMIQAAREAAAMARGDAIPGAVIHAAPATAPTDDVGRRPVAVPERTVVAEDTDGELA
jgi:hypothetical protein